MKRTLVISVCTVAAIAFAQAQQGGRQPNAPMPTKAEIEKVVQTISSDKTKTQHYCELGKVNQQMALADQKNDTKALERLGKQADDLEEKIGPEFIRFMDALDQADHNSSDGKDVIAAVETLDKLCPEK